MKSHKLSIKEVILVNLNIMLGAGAIVNSVSLTQKTGLFGCLSYLLVGVFMLPLIHSIARLISMHPSGGFYAYAKPISPLLAFISCWTYFFGKLASATLILFVSATFIKQLFPILLAPINTVSLTLIILTLFIYLNLFNLKTGSVFQQLFFIAKSIPVLFVIVSGIISLQSILITPNPVNIYDVLSTIPLVLYSFTGFESACAISRNMENPSKNAPKAIFFSFFLIIGIYTIFQFLVSIMLLPNIANVTSYKETFPYITTLLKISPASQNMLSALINLVIGFSTLGGAYGIIFSNTWNLYTLAENKHTFLPSLILKVNKHHIPSAAVIAQGLICLLLLLATCGNPIPLQQIAVLGTTLAYTISTLALILQTKRITPLPVLALITCICLLSCWVISIQSFGFKSLYLCIGMTAFGLTMFYAKKAQS